MNLPIPLSKKVLFSLLISIFGFAYLAVADDIYIWAEEAGGNVVIYHRGSIDLTGFPVASGGSVSSIIKPDEGIFFNSDGDLDIYSGAVPDGSTRTWGSGSGTDPDTISGDRFGVTGGTTLGLPQGYVSGTQIKGSMIFLSTTLADLGVDTAAFTYNTEFGANTVHMFIVSPAAIAETAAKIAAQTNLLRKIRKLKKKAKKLKKKGKKAKAKKLLKKVKKLKKQLAALG